MPMLASRVCDFTFLLLYTGVPWGRGLKGAKWRFPLGKLMQMRVFVRFAYIYKAIRVICSEAVSGCVSESVSE